MTRMPETLSAVCCTLQPARQAEWDSLSQQFSDLLPGVELQAQRDEGQGWPGNFLASLERISPDAKWGLYLEDDVFLAPDFATRLEGAMRYAGDRPAIAVISLYCADRTQKPGKGYLPYSLFTTQGLLIRTTIIPPLLEFLREWWKVPRPYGPGYATSVYLKLSGLRSVRAMPSIIQHRPVVSLITPKKRIRQSESYRAAYGEIPNV